MPQHELTPYRKLELEDPDKRGTYLDVTKQLGSSVVSLLQEESAIDQLSFQLKHGATYWIEKVIEGLKCRFTGGYAVDIPGRTTKRLVFEGIVTKYQPILPDNGKPEIKMVCHTELFKLTRSKPGRVTYPAIPVKGFPFLYSRDFHFRSHLKISDIVEGILTEHGIAIKQIKIHPELDYEFTYGNHVSQNEDENDYDFVIRLLMGKSKKTQKDGGAKKKVNHLVNARARLFMEPDSSDGIQKVHVVPEDDLIADKGTVSFVYQSPGLVSVNQAAYDPTSPNAELVIRGISLRENKQDAAGKEIQHHKDVKKNARGRRSVGSAVQPSDTLNKGAQRKDVLSGSDGDNPPSDLGFNYRINRELLVKDQKAGLLPKGLAIGSLFSGTLSGQYKWKDVKKYFVPRQTSFVPSARALPGGKGVPRQATTPTGFTGGLGKGSGGKGAKGTKASGVQIQKPRAKKYGTTLSCWTHGNVFVSCRRSYEMKFPFGRYKGLWYLYKLEQRWGDTFKVQVEFGR